MRTRASGLKQAVPLLPGSKAKVDMDGKVKALDEHKRLASVVKTIHADLRKKLRASNGDFKTVWTQHCQDQSVLSKYAESMRTLAQDHWTKNSHTRIDWCRENISEYFHGGGLKKALEKEEKRRKQETRMKTCNKGKTEIEVEEVLSGSIGATSVSGKLTTDRLTEGKNQCDDDEEAAVDTTINVVTKHLTPGTHDSDSNTKTVVLVPSLSVKGDIAASVIANNAQHLESKQEVAMAAAEQTQRTLENQESEKSVGGDIYTHIQLPFEGKIRLLDVGSCYNPFLEFEEFLAVGIDIAPATQSVHQCDFLNLRTTAPLQQSPQALETYLGSLSSPIESLPACCFHVVVFCLLLEYLPAAEQRWLCCVRAHQLLQRDGLLVIVTPDSKSQHCNAPMIRSWKTAIESLGFSRWRYVKLEHLHCMAFRKTSSHSQDIQASSLIAQPSYEDPSSDPSRSGNDAAGSGDLPSSCAVSEDISSYRSQAGDSRSGMLGSRDMPSGRSHSRDKSSDLLPGEEAGSSFVFARSKDATSGLPRSGEVGSDQVQSSDLSSGLPGSGGASSDLLRSLASDATAAMMYIPQDLSDVTAENREEEERDREDFEDPEARQEFFAAVDSELPGFVSDDSNDD